MRYLILALIFTSLFILDARTPRRRRHCSHSRRSERNREFWDKVERDHKDAEKREREQKTWEMRYGEMQLQYQLKLMQFKINAKKLRFAHDHITDRENEIALLKVKQDLFRLQREYEAMQRGGTPGMK